ncbi:hypothetical protein Btru_003242 [Bulinus truncatus]|nr:hypothetical protein Btru_003242 [Bulinus truncatus]
MGEKTQVMESCSKNHFFEMNPASGVFVYIVDHDKPVYVKFTNTIKISVLFDTLNNPNKKSGDVISVTCAPLICVGQENSSITDYTNKYGDETSGLRENSELGELKKAQNKVSQSRTDERTMSYGNDVELKSDGVDSDKEKQGVKRHRRQSKLMPVSCVEKSVPKVMDNECQAVAEGSPETGSIKSSSYSCRVKKKKKNVLHSKRKTRRVKAKDQCKVLDIKKKRKRLPVTLEVKHNVESIKIESNPENDSEKVMTDKSIKCEYCGVEFGRQLDYYNHRRAEESKHACGECGKVEPYEAHLIVHMQKHRHARADTTSISQPFSETATSVEELKTDAKCKSGKRKNKKIQMACNMCGLVLSSSDSLKIHTMLHTGEFAYKCCVCGEKFSSLSSRQHHMDTHISVQRFKCNPCGQRFPSRADLAKHQLTHEVKCALCGEVFPNKTSRTCHFRVSHPEDILKCSLCSKMFACQSDLSKHMDYHKKGKKEQCPVCGNVVSKLKDHMLLHSQQAQEKMFVCDQCPMSYLRKSNLDRHMLTHTGEKPYACNICTKSFRSNGMLRKHLLTHTQERPYQCETCGKRCSLRSNLNIHMRIHNINWLYSCTLCPQGFNHKNSLRYHMKSKHSSEAFSVSQAVTLLADQQAAPSLMSEMEVDHTQRNLSLGSSSSLEPDILIKEENTVSQHEYGEYTCSSATYPTSTCLPV